jgi:hypothetical protein
MSAAQTVVAACLAQVLLTFAVGLRLLATRVGEMRRRRIHPQSVANSVQMASKLEDLRAADNFRNLFEVPVLFFALCAMALATGLLPGWLQTGAWLFVAARVAHSLIQCSYNKVMHRFAAFLASFLLVTVLWLAFGWSYIQRVS